MCVYTQEGYCVGVLDDAGRLFNRGGFYVTTLKMKLKNMQHIKEALKTYETTCVTKDDISEALVVDRKTDIAYALHKDSADYLSGEKQADKDCSSAHILILHRIYVPVYNRHTLNFVGVMDSEYNIYDTRGVYVATGSINKKNKQRKNPLSSNNRFQ